MSQTVSEVEILISVIKNAISHSTKLWGEMTNKVVYTISNYLSLFRVLKIFLIKFKIFYFFINFKLIYF
jgi:hypothetical protein